MFLFSSVIVQPHLTSANCVVSTRSNVDEVVGMISSGKAAVDDCDGLGRSCLHFAASNGHVHLIRALVEHHASVDKKDNVWERSFVSLFPCIQVCAHGLTWEGCECVRCGWVGLGVCTVSFLSTPTLP